MPDLSSVAERRFQAALEVAGARDPRKFYRERLRELKAKNPKAYRAAVEYYEEHLLPAVAREDSDPLEEWLEYGRVLASLTVEGKTVQIDASGLATPYARPVTADRLVLHLPASTRDAALAIGIPPHPSPAQRATCDLLLGKAVAER